MQVWRKDERESFKTVWLHATAGYQQIVKEDRKLEFGRLKKRVTKAEDELEDMSGK